MKLRDHMNAHYTLVKVLVAQGYSVDAAFRIATQMLTEDKPLIKINWPPRWLGWS